MSEIDILLDQAELLGTSADDDAGEAIPLVAKLAISQLGDVWLLGRNRVMCGSAIDETAMARLMNGRQAIMCCQDPPWNIAVRDIAGRGKTQYRPFPMANGEMSDDQFRTFMRQQLRCNAAHSVMGAVIQVFIDWRGVEKVIAAGEAEGLKLINVCVWAKSNGGMSGGPWRSQHELIVVFAKPGAPIRNPVQLGRYGRYRTNLWQEPGQNSFGPERMKALERHPTSKPVALIADAIRDVTDLGDIVLDSFLGSGTTVMAAERCGRIAYGMELDPLYVDVIVRRWEEFSKQEARLEATGQGFAEVAAGRTAHVTLAPPGKPMVRTRVRPSA